MKRTNDAIDKSINDSKNGKLCNISKLVLWHQRLGHPSNEALKHTELVSGKMSECET